ncbi:MAG: ASCH domain-containing protein [Anaerolineae bacterium]|jgi:uncharacterized protein YhfF|nr:ASCH domain-containing protein [Anaerolineae bacterium]
MQQSTSVQEMWNAYLHSLGEDPATTEKTFSAWHFCDNAPCADALADLVKAGRKRGTTSTLWEYEAAQDPLPAVGEYSVITNWEGQAQAIIRTIGVEIIPFNQVAADFARTEGEGDCSLAYWREVHWEVFTRSLAAYGRRPVETMPVVCETFEVVYGADPA